MERKMLFAASTWSHIQNFHLPYLRHFQGLGWRVHAACGDAPASAPYTERVLEVPFTKSMGAPRNFRAAALLRELIREEGYELISVHTSLAAFFTRLALLGMERRPLVVNTVHGYLFDGQTPLPKRRLLLAAEQWMAPVTDLVLTMNRWDLQTAQRYRLGANVVHIPGIGVDFAGFSRAASGSRERLREALGIPQGAFVLLYAAEFSKRKSQEVLIRAMRRLPEQAVLVLTGDGALCEQCRQMAQQFGLDRRVLFPGYVRNMPEWCGMADAAVSGSRSEGLPFHIMEAMYAGLPIVASDVKGTSDLLSDHEAGLLYPYGDDAACAAQIQRLMDSDRLRRQLGARAREHVEQYSLERVLPVVLGLYDGLLLEQTVRQRR